MRVMCVASMSLRGKRPSFDTRPIQHPEVGEICEVIDQEKSEGLVFYTLAEYPAYQIYDARCFATLPESTPTELYEQEFEGVMQ